MVVVTVLLTGILIIVGGAFAIVGRLLRSRERAILEDLEEHLTRQGIDASLLPEDSPEGLHQDDSLLQKIARFFLIGDIGYIRVRGMNYDLATVRIASYSMSESSSGSFFSSQSRTEKTVVRYHHIVRTAVSDGQAVEARLNKETKGLFSRRIVDVAWHGGRLAALLNSQAELNAAIIRLLTPKDGLKVAYDRKNNVVRIILTMHHGMRRIEFLGFSWSKSDEKLPLEGTLDIINRIAGFVRSDELNTDYP